MDNNIIVAVLGFAGTLVGTFTGILTSAKLTAYRLEQLEKRVSEHNNFARRMPVVEEKIENLFRQVTELERRMENEN
ncbi:MAG: hypothetical protein ACI4QY_07540 [Oscillospiraceae bacterium]